MSKTCAYCIEPAIAVIEGIPDTAGEPYKAVQVCARHGHDRIVTLATIVGMSTRK